MSSTSQTKALFPCPVCCEHKTAAETHVFRSTSCPHGACLACLAQWFHRLEKTGQERLPTCLVCRSPIDADEVTQILGRPYTPSRGTGPTANMNQENGDPNHEMDDLTRQWLQTHTRTCNNCGAHVEKEDGCDKMECLCGYRFCFACGSQGSSCTCTPENHSFWDNVHRRNALRLPPPVLNLAVATASSMTMTEEQDPAASQELRRTGTTLRKHLEMRRQVEGRRLRKESQRVRREREADDVLEVSKYGSWLFLPAGLRVMQELVSPIVSRKKLSRRDRHISCLRETFWMAEQLRNKYVFNGCWLFCRSTEQSIRMLSQLMQMDRVRSKRRSGARRLFYQRSQIQEDAQSLVWLFCRTKQASLRVLNQLRVTTRVRLQREKLRLRQWEESKEPFRRMTNFWSWTW